MILTEPQTRHDVRVFSIRSLTEVLIKVGLNYLNFHGSEHQARLPSGMKAVWILEYMAAKFEKPVEAKRPALVARFPARRGHGSRRSSRRLSCLPHLPDGIEMP